MQIFLANMARTADEANTDADHFVFSFRGDASGVSESLTLSASGGGAATSSNHQLCSERHVRCCEEHEHEDCDQPRTIIVMQLSTEQTNELVAQFLVRLDLFFALTICCL